MNTLDFDEARCQTLRAAFDDYLAGEADTDKTSLIDAHLPQCEGCREELAARRLMRERVREAATRDRAPEGLRQSVLAGIHAESGRSRRKVLVWGVAAAAGFVVVSLVSLRMIGMAPHELAYAKFKATRLAAELTHVASFGLGDHIYCAVFRHLDAPMSAKKAAMALEEEDAPTAEAVRAAIPESYELRLAHRCHFKGREFLHFALLSDEGELVSAMFMAREDGEVIEGEIEVSAVGEYEVATFATGDRWAFVVSELGQETNRLFAANLRNLLAEADSITDPA